jgi:hypothetical protein
MTLQTEAFLDKAETEPIVVGVGTYEDMQFVSLTQDETNAVIGALELALSALGEGE